LNHWLPYIGFWVFVAIFVAVFAVYMYAGVHLIHRMRGPASLEAADSFAQRRPRVVGRVAATST
jgi:hypothetical protein